MECLLAGLLLVAAPDDEALIAAVKTDDVSVWVRAGDDPLLAGAAPP